MLSVYALKPRFQNLLRPLANRLAELGVTANQVTITACVLPVALGLDLAFGSRTWILLPATLFVRMALNAIDGMLAREHNQQSRFGAILNEVTDLVSDAALTLPFACLPGWSPLWVGLAALSAALTEAASMAAGPPRPNDGPFGKSDRAVALGALGFWLAFGWPIPVWIVEWMPRLWVVLCLVTIFNRSRRAL